MSTHHDVVIIGSGAGGGTVARALAPTGANILILERGGFVPREPANADARAVWGDGRYRSRETWQDASGGRFHPYTHHCVGGNTKFWGSVLYRLRPQDFQAVSHADGVSPAWPITYDTLAPYYAQAERMYHVHGRAGIDPTEAAREPFVHDAIAHEPLIEEIATQLRAVGLHPAPLPLGLMRPGEADGCALCSTCNSYPCYHGAKADAETCGVQPALARPNVTLWTNAFARRLVGAPGGARVASIEVERDGALHRVSADLFVVACGAVNSAALFLSSSDSRHPAGLANSSGLVGCRYMAHHASFLSSVNPLRRNTTVFQKTLGINDFYGGGNGWRFPLGNVQSQGRVHPIIPKTQAPWLPMWALEAWFAHGVDWLAMTEDLPRRDNRVSLGRSGEIRLHYRPTNVRAHRALVRELKRTLHAIGDWVVLSYSYGRRNTTHQCGTMCFGDDPRTSVLDPWCRVHDLENVFVVDASFFPSSGAVNPGLTIVAQALRTADHIRTTHFRQPAEVQ